MDPHLPEATDTLVRALEPDDATDVASLRQRAMSSGHLIELGPMVVESLVVAVTREDSCYGFAAESGGRVVGYVLITADAQRLLTLAVLGSWRAFRRLVSYAVLNPRFTLLVARRLTVSRPRQSGRRPTLRLLDIGVEPANQGSGVGRRLIEAALREAAARGYDAIGLSVHPENTAAIALYSRMGFVVDPPVQAASSVSMSRGLR